MGKACQTAQFVSLTKQIYPLPFPALHLSSEFPYASAVLGFGFFSKVEKTKYFVQSLIRETSLFCGSPLLLAAENIIWFP